jgi:hypothetical protein
VGKGESPETGTPGADRRILRQQPAWTKSHGSTPSLQEDGLLAARGGNGPAESVSIESPGDRKIPDSQDHPTDPGLHRGRGPFFGRWPRRSQEILQEDRPVATAFVLAAAEEGDDAPPGSEGGQGLRPELCPVAPDIFLPGQPAPLECKQKVAGGRDVSGPFVHLGFADSPRPESHDEDAGAILGRGPVVDTLRPESSHTSMVPEAVGDGKRIFPSPLNRVV